MKNQNGLSLVELMISITLGLVLMAGVVQVFVSSKTVFTAQQGMSRVQETGRLAMEFIGRDVRIGAYFGCSNVVNPTNPTGDTFSDGVLAGLPAGLHQNFTQGLMGYTDATVPAGSLAGNYTVASPSDVLVIRGANERGMPVSAANNATVVFGYTPETSLTNGCVEGFCVGSVGVISNCQKGRFFLITAVGIAGHQVSLTHSAWAMSPNAVPDSNYLSGSILPVHTIVYFVATKNGATIPSLWQQIDNTSTEILQGVENMSVTYGCPADLGCGFSDYRTAPNVPATSWPRISSVHVELLVRGLDENTNDEAQPYTFAGQPVTPTDRVLRQVFDATFAVRSKFN